MGGKVSQRKLFSICKVLPTGHSVGCVFTITGGLSCYGSNDDHGNNTL